MENKEILSNSLNYINNIKQELMSNNNDSTKILSDNLIHQNKESTIHFSTFNARMNDLYDLIKNID